jgi:flagellar biosynthesis component FlhA
MKTYVWITTSFEGWHHWENAPDTVPYLRDNHRHIFHVKLWKEVQEQDREIEFITFKHNVESYIEQKYEGHSFHYSCEMIATDLLNHFQASIVEVSEDGENGARVER